MLFPVTSDLQGVCVPDGSEVVHGGGRGLFVHVQLLTQDLQAPPDRPLLHPARLRRLFAPHPCWKLAGSVWTEFRKWGIRPREFKSWKTRRRINLQLPVSAQPQHFRSPDPQCNALARKVQRSDQSEARGATEPLLSNRPCRCHQSVKKLI